MVFFNFRLNTSEKEKREEIRLHAAAGTANLTNFFGFSFDSGIYFKKYDKTIAGFYHLFSRKHRRISFSTTPKWHLADAIFIGKMHNKDGAPHFCGFIIPSLYLCMPLILFSLLTVFSSWHFGILVAMNIVAVALHILKCYQLLKQFFASQK